MFRQSSSVILLISVILVIRAESATFPSEIQKCHRNDDKCLLDRINEITQKYPHGYEPLGVPDLEPFNLPEFSTTQTGGSVDLRMAVKDLKMHGFSKQQYTKVSGHDTDKQKRVLEIVSTAPKWTLKGKYETSGKILLLPLEGNGDFVLEMYKPVVTSKMKMSIVERGGKKHVKVDKYAIKFDVEKATIQLDNLFNGDKTLGDNLNKVLNENWKVLWEELSPSIEKTTADHLKKFFQDVFDKFPIDELFLPD